MDTDTARDLVYQALAGESTDQPVGDLTVVEGVDGTALVLTEAERELYANLRYTVSGPAAGVDGGASSVGVRALERLGKLTALRLESLADQGVAGLGSTGLAAARAALRKDLIDTATAADRVGTNPAPMLTLAKAYTLLGGDLELDQEDDRDDRLASAVDALGTAADGLTREDLPQRLDHLFPPLKALLDTYGELYA